MYICNTHDVFKTTKRTDAAIEHGSAICPPKKPMSNRKGACLYCRKYTLFLMCTQYQTHMMHRTCILCLLRMLSFLRHFCSTVNTVAASMSQVIGALLKKLFDKDCWDISTSGVLLPGSNGVNHKLFASWASSCKMVLHKYSHGTAELNLAASSACSANTSSQNSGGCCRLQVSNCCSA